MFKKFRCIAKGILTSIDRGAIISGHDFVYQGMYQQGNCLYEVLKCNHCGKRSFAWTETR